MGLISTIQFSFFCYKLADFDGNCIALFTDARHVGSPKDLGVGDSVLPFDQEKTPKAAEVEPVEPLLLSGVCGP